MILVALCALLQIVPAGVGELYNETDGQYAGAAKRMAQGASWLIPENNGEPRLVKPPLLYWMMAASFRVFGMNEFAARLPNALGITAWVLGTFVLGTQLGGVRRGFTAGVVLMTLLGTATLGRIVMPEPVFCAFIVWAMVCGWRMLASPEANSWATALWTLAGLAAFAKGVHGLLYPLATVCIAGIVVREWRPRLRRLLDGPGVFAVLAINLPWYLYVESQFPGWLGDWIRAEQVGHLAGNDAPATARGNVPPVQFLLLHLAWLFPWSIVLVVDGLRAARSFRFEKEGIFLAAWACVIVAPLPFLGQRQDYYAMAAWPVFALLAAAVRERVGISRVSTGILVATSVAGLLVAVLLPLGAGESAAVAERATAWTTVLGFGTDVWAGLRWLGAVCFGLSGLVLLMGWTRPRLAFAAVAVCAGVFSLCGVAGYALVAPYFSLAGVAEELNRPALAETPIVFDGGLDTASSLLFYTNRRLILIDDVGGVERSMTREEFAGRWRAGDGFSFVTERARVVDWERLLGGLPAPAAVCGTQVVFTHGE